LRPRSAAIENFAAATADRLVPGCDPHPSMLCGTMGGGRRLATRLAFTDQSD